MKKLLFIILFLLFTALALKPLTTTYLVSNQVLAEEDEDHEEDRNEDEEDEKDDDDYVEEDTLEEITELKKQIEELIEASKPVFVTQIDAGYDVDTDGDGLVDALDPNPTVHQKLYFTDTDNDSIPDFLDKFPNKDDLTQVEDTDKNSNGIIDSYE